MRLRFNFWRWQVRLVVQQRERVTWEQIRAGIEAGEMIACVSRCLWCGRQTPHEVCHEHSTEFGFDPESVECICKLGGTGEDQDPEDCTDPACPVWETEERERLLSAAPR